MDHVLNNPVYYALLSRDAHLGFSAGEVYYFNEEVSPFAGFDKKYSKGFKDLYHALPADRKILYATPQHLDEPPGWQILVAVEGIQFVYTKGPSSIQPAQPIVPLQQQHVEEMVELATLTKPGPFSKRTIEFGHYYGIFDHDRLVAMAGQRLHVEDYTEISAVCTHPDYLGRGYAAALIQQQLDLIYSQGQHPFLHVRADNERAIALYHRLGFEISRQMNFYFMQKRGAMSM